MIDTLAYAQGGKLHTASLDRPRDSTEENVKRFREKFEGTDARPYRLDGGFHFNLAMFDDPNQAIRDVAELLNVFMDEGIFPVHTLVRDYFKPKLHVQVAPAIPNARAILQSTGDNLRETALRIPAVSDLGFNLQTVRGTGLIRIESENEKLTWETLAAQAGNTMRWLWEAANKSAEGWSPLATLPPHFRKDERID